LDKNETHFLLDMHAKYPWTLEGDKFPLPNYYS